MWFKNLQVYRFTQPFTATAEALETQLQTAPFHPCSGQDAMRQGWVPPLQRFGTQRVHAANGYLLLCARKQEKLLPASVVREFISERVEAIEAEQHRKVTRKEREALREEVTQELLPRAFTRTQHTYAYIDPRAGLLVVDAASYKKAEELTGLLRKTLGSLPVVPVVTQQSPAAVMTRWLQHGEELPPDLLLADECELRESGDDGSIVRCKRQDLTADEISAHLAAGKQVVKLALSWEERIHCVLSDDLSIKRLRFGEDILSEASDNAADDDPASRFDADFALMTLELSRFLPRLYELLGGEAPRAAN